jgi:hypothetical protein
MLPVGKTAKGRDGSFRLGTLGRKDTLRAGTADAVNLRGICQCGFLLMLMLRSQDGRLAMLIGFCDSRIIMVLPV